MRTGHQLRLRIRRSSGIARAYQPPFILRFEHLIIHQATCLTLEELPNLQDGIPTLSMFALSLDCNVADKPSGGPFRSTRLRAQSLIPNSRIANVAAVQQTLVVDAQRQNAVPANGADDDSKNVKRRETIFGPDVGEDDEPGWTKPDEGQKIDVNVVKGWVEKAKSEEVSL